MQNKTKVTLAGLAIVVVIALVVLVSHFSHSSQTVGSVPTVTTNLPSLGLNSLVVGNGCGFQSGIPCVGSGVISSFGITSGGYELINATGTAYQLAASDITNFATVGFLATTTTTVTLPASSTFPTTFLPNVGDSKIYTFFNASTTGAVQVILAGGTGTTLQTATSSKTLVSNATGNITIYRLPNSNLDVTLDINN